MALIKCPECGREISDKAGKCPECGYPIKVSSHSIMKGIQNKLIFNTTKRRIIIVTVAICIIILTLIGIINNNPLKKSLRLINKDLDTKVEWVEAAYQKKNSVCVVSIRKGIADDYAVVFLDSKTVSYESMWDDYEDYIDEWKYKWSKNGKSDKELKKITEYQYNMIAKPQYIIPQMELDLSTGSSDWIVYTHDKED